MAHNHALQATRQQLRSLELGGRAPPLTQRLVGCRVA